MALGGRNVKLRCRPAVPAIGQLHTSTRAGSDQLAGSFHVEFANCENAESGKAIEWPPAPITVRGIFRGSPIRPSPAPKILSPRTVFLIDSQCRLDYKKPYKNPNVMNLNRATHTSVAATANYYWWRVTQLAVVASVRSAINLE